MCGAKSGAVDNRKSLKVVNNFVDNDLAAVVEAWPKLPEEINHCVMAMVDRWR
jgi:hypothetical protein